MDKLVCPCHTKLFFYGIASLKQKSPYPLIGKRYGQFYWFNLQDWTIKIYQLHLLYHRRILWSNYRQVFWLTGLPTHCSFPSTSRWTVVICNFRHRLQRRVRVLMDFPFHPHPPYADAGTPVIGLLWHKFSKYKLFIPKSRYHLLPTKHVSLKVRPKDVLLALRYEAKANSGK